jgi:NAD(P)-dependent dehydrogenase (short-subunit alcohol dehydrogenase family)
MDMKSKVVLITGATNGIGKVTALELAKMGANVVIVGRNSQKTAVVAEEIRHQLNGSGAVDTLVGNLASLKEIENIAQEFKAKYQRLDVLINNAGAYFTERKLSPDGYEMTFALNHLNYFYLTSLLLDLIKASAPARIVNVSSSAHYAAKLDFDNLNQEKKFNGWKAYAQSKLMNIYFTSELAKRLQGSGVTTNVLHPGFVATNFGRSNGGVFNPLFRLVQLAAISPEEGAKTTLYLASSPDVENISGEFFAKSQNKKASREAYNAEAAAKLWQLTEKLIGEKLSNLE